MITQYNADFEIVSIIVQAFLSLYIHTRYFMESWQNKRFSRLALSLMIVTGLDIFMAIAFDFHLPYPVAVASDIAVFVSNYYYSICIVKYIASFIYDKDGRRPRWNIFNNLFFIFYVITINGYIVEKYVQTTIEARDPRIAARFYLSLEAMPILFILEAIGLMMTNKEKFTKLQRGVFSVFLLLGIAVPILQFHLFPSYKITYFYDTLNIFIILLLVETPDEQELNTVLTNLSLIKGSLEKEVADEEKRLIDLENKETRLYKQLMYVMSKTIDAKDKYTCGHSIRVAKYSSMLAKRLGLSEEQQTEIYRMGVVHDLGKIAVPNAIINKPGKLTDEEFAKMKSHPVVGSDILMRVKSWPNLADGARWHHERIDGRGYPDHLKGDEIPYFARIICVADAYDAMTSYRSYRGVMEQKAVREQVVNGLGSQFDFAIGQKMLEIIDEDVDYKLHEYREDEEDEAEESEAS